MKNPVFAVEFYMICVLNLDSLLGTSVDNFKYRTANAVEKIRDCGNLLEEVQSPLRLRIIEPLQ